MFLPTAAVNGGPIRYHDGMDSPPPTSPPPPQTYGLIRWLYIGLGCFFVGLGLVGTLLPVLPTTPFLLLASYFFVRSSPALHQRLLHSRLFGRFLRDWDTHRAVRPRVKLVAYLLIPIVIVSSAVIAELEGLWLVVLIVLGMVGLFVVWRLPVLKDEKP